MTAQLPDVILVLDVKRDLYGNPLESFWELSGRQRPSFLVKPDCMRGYIAAWQIRKSELFLMTVKGSYRRSSFLFLKKLRPFTMKTLFPKGRFKPVKAIWYSGRLRVPTGSMIRFEDAGYNSRFDEEMIVTIDRGNVTRLVTIDNTQKKLTIVEEAYPVASPAPPAHRPGP